MQRSAWQKFNLLCIFFIFAVSNAVTVTVTVMSSSEVFAQKKLAINFVHGCLSLSASDIADTPSPWIFLSFPSAKDQTFNDRYPGNSTSQSSMSLFSQVSNNVIISAPLESHGKMQNS